MIIKDCIYRYITVPALCQQFLNTPEFQRLRRVKQLGICHYVYPSATHTRFEHCLGVMHLAGQMVTNLKSGSERERELVMLAGMMHDVGHLAYSHLLDDIAVDKYTSHEERSLGIVENINDRIKALSAIELEQVQAMIMGKILEEEKPWKYQIVSNKLYGIDVDRMDYLQRDAYHTGMPGYQPDYIINNVTIDKDGNLAFYRKAEIEIENLFQTRKRMFSTVYFHKTSQKLEQIYSHMIREYIKQPSCNLDFSDDYIAEITLRGFYPNIFDLIDARCFSKIVEIFDLSKMEKKVPKYCTDSNDLKELMDNVRFV